MHRFGVAGVSIPFIAGQWSLREAAWLVEVLGAMSQSPSLRGSGRFEGTSPDPDWIGRLNPLHCGAVVASDAKMVLTLASLAPVSIPFIAGQWSLPCSSPSPSR